MTGETAVPCPCRTPDTVRQSHKLYERQVLPYRDGLRAHAYQLTDNKADAEDLLQETLVRAYTRLHLVTNTASIHAWLYTIQLNLFRSRYRRSGVIRRESLCLHDEERFTVLNMDLPLEMKVVYRLQQQAIFDALQCLPLIYRVPIYLADIQEQSYEEIASQLNIPLGTVRSRLNRGRHRLRRTLYSWHG